MDGEEQKQTLTLENMRFVYQMVSTSFSVRMQRISMVFAIVTALLVGLLFWGGMQGDHDTLPAVLALSACYILGLCALITSVLHFEVLNFDTKNEKLIDKRETRRKKLEYKRKRSEAEDRSNELIPIDLEKIMTGDMEELRRAIITISRLSERIRWWFMIICVPLTIAILSIIYTILQGSV
jgi:hypothetical protein